MRYKLNELKVGQKVIVNTWAGGNRSGTIDMIEKDIKNGYPGIEYTDNKGDSWWCYLDQVIEVRK